MTQRLPIAVAILALAGASLAGCGGSSSEAPIAPSSKLVPGTGGSGDQIILTAEGEQRIGLRTATVRGASANVVIPFSAIVYAPDGRTYAFTNPAPLTFAEVPIVVGHITGDSAYLLRGPRAGTKIVTVGAEELYGVQTGVLAET